MLPQRRRKGVETIMEKRQRSGSVFGGKRGAALLACILASVLCMGCGASSEGFDSGRKNFSDMQDAVSEDSATLYPMGGSSYDDSESFEYTEESKRAEDGRTAEAPDTLQGRKLITTVRLDVETRQFEEAMARLENQVQGMGGYIENMNSYNGSRYSGSRSLRYANLTVRIPQAGLREFLGAVSEVSNVVRRSESVDDVTLSYVDMESRRDTLRTEQSRLLEFLDRAGTIEEIITIEERLSNVRYQLESMESRLRAMDNKVDYATVELSVSEVEELTMVEEPGFRERIGEGFVDSLLNIRDWAEELFIWLVVHLPYLFILALPVCIALLVIWLERRKQGGRKASGKPVPPPAGQMNAWQGTQARNGQNMPFQGQDNPK